jgi:methyl-accepting chemotaxis protein
MADAPRKRISFLRKTFIFTHLTGLGAGIVFPLITASMIGSAARSAPFVISCLIMGFGLGACMYQFVRVSLKSQLREQLALLQPLTGAVSADGGTIESLNIALQTSIRQIEEFVRPLLATVDEFVPHYRTLAASSSYLSERARDGLTAAQATRKDVGAMNEKQQEIAAQMELLADRTQDEAAISRELSASLEEMAGAMDHSNAQFLETTTSVDEMASSLREAADQADKIARSVETTARDLDGIGEAFARIRGGASASADATAAVQQDAENGLQVVSASREEMDRIEAESRKATEAMTRLSHQTGEVAKIIEVIRELVSDTELLAFNAAIIAAQAGENGKGFSVVAEEIRDLADRTTNSAQDIQRIVKAIGGDTKEVTGAIAATGQRIARGKQLSQETSAALEKIVGSARQAANSSEDIVQLTGEQEHRARELVTSAGQGMRSVKAVARAIQEQQQAINRIQQGVGQMKSAADQVSRGMEEQVRANREFDKALAGREGQIQAVDAAIRFQTGVAERVFSHFNISEKRLRNNAERAEVINKEIDAMEVLSTRLRNLAEQFQKLSEQAN